jgi:hypothetical protein
MVPAYFIGYAIVRQRYLVFQCMPLNAIGFLK